MARRSAAPQEDAQPLVEESNDMDTLINESFADDAVSESAEDAVILEDGIETVAAEEKAEEEVIDLSEFVTAAAEYVGSEPDEDGTVDATNVKTLYAGLSRKGKIAATKHLQARQEESLSTDDWAAAKAYLNLGKEIKAAPVKTPKEPKATKNPTVAFVSRVATLQLAYSIAMSSVPEGIDENWQEQAAALAATPSELVKSAADKLAKAKLGLAKKEKDGPTRARHDVGKHIVEAFTSHPVGTSMDVQTIRSFDSSEYGEGNRPGAAAINAHIKNAKFALEGLEVVRNEKGVPSGVRKVA